MDVKNNGVILMSKKTMFEKIWDNHVIHQEEGKPSILYIDLHLVHEVTSPQAFEGLRLSGRKVRRPELTFATMDHNVPTKDRFNITDPISKQQIDTLTKNCQDFGVTLFDLDTIDQGLSMLWGLSLDSRTRARRLYAATATPPRMAHSERLRSGSERARLSMCSRRNVCSRPRRRRWRFALSGSASLALPRRI